MATSAFTLDGIQAENYAEPATVGELAEGLAACSSAGQPAFVFGAGSRIRFGNVGPAYSTAFSTRKLDQVIDYSPEDLVIAVGPGVTVAQLRSVLEQHGQELTLDVADPERETIGGVFASGLSGPRRIQSGALKDSTLGIEVVQPDGTVTKAGGMVVKNVTGYDLPRLHNGANGAFGAITRLNFKVLPAPERTAELVAMYDEVEKAHTAAAALLQSSFDLTAIYLTWDRERAATESWHVHVWLSGSESVLGTQVQRVEELVSSTAQPHDITNGELERGDLASFRPYIDLASDHALARSSVPASNQGHMAERLARTDTQSLCADLGSGLIYSRAVPTVEWREAIRRIDDRAVFLSLPSELRSGIDVYGGVESVQEGLLRQLKREFDPEGTLNRGRFVLGI